MKKTKQKKTQKNITFQVVTNFTKIMYGAFEAARVS